MKQNLLILLPALVLASCGGTEQSPDACACANEIHMQGPAAPNYQKCMDAVKADPKFKDDFSKCTAAAIMHRDTTGMRGAPTEFVPEKDGTYTLAVGRDSIAWTGQKVTGASHTGIIRARSGSATTANGQLTGGEIVLDMTSLGIPEMDGDPKGQKKLLDHLKSDDFFSIANHPEAKFVITSAEKTGTDYLIKGSLTLKGKTNEALGRVKISGVGTQGLVLTGNFAFDRSQFDVRYGSGKFFDNLGNDMILDQVTIGFKLLFSN